MYREKEKPCSFHIPDVAVSALLIFENDGRIEYFIGDSGLGKQPEEDWNCRAGDLKLRPLMLR